MGAIRINQMGYSLSGEKHVVYAGKGNTLKLYKAATDDLVFEVPLKELGQDEMSGDYVCSGNFELLQQPGSYYLMINNERSLEFTVSEQQYKVCTDSLLKAFYYQRCGTELPSEFAGKWGHPACHLQLSYLYSDDQELETGDSLQERHINTVGGWHDAGDYGRYTIATVKTVADLLLAYEHYESVFDHSISIPESELEGSDILHEAKVGLDFLFKMQRTSDGAVYTKVATKTFPGIIMPQLDTEPLLVFDVSSPATAGFAAVMAMAALTYQKVDCAYALQCLVAAEYAYQWLKENPEPLFFNNPKGVISGEYGDYCDIDERYWAAAQLYKTTGKEQYHKDFLSFFSLLDDKVSLGWKRVGGYGSIAYLFSERKTDQDTYQILKQDWLNYASLLEERSNKDGYGITLVKEEYVWGSLMVLLNQSMNLIIVNRLIGTPKYDSCIRKNWNYLFGCNPMDISYVTGLGERSVRNPHHRPSAGDGVIEPVPGLVVGGPCYKLEDELTRQYCSELPPAKCFIDHYDSYSTNEIDIYWNSPAVYVGAYLVSLEKN